MVFNSRFRIFSQRKTGETGSIVNRRQHARTSVLTMEQIYITDLSMKLLACINSIVTRECVFFW